MPSAPTTSQTTGVPLLQGPRIRIRADGEPAPPSRSSARRWPNELWPGEDPIGRRIRVPGVRYPLRTIVGIVGDVRHYGLPPAGDDAGLRVRMPRRSYPQPMLSLVVRVAADRDPLAYAGSAREQVRAIDSQQAVNNLRTFEAIVARSLAARRFTLVLLIGFAFTALVLAVVGLYGALSYLVTQRQREIGVRVALGAGAADIRSLVMRQGMTPTVAGLCVGVLTSIALSRLVESMLYDTSARDALTYAVVAS